MASPPDSPWISAHTALNAVAEETSTPTVQRLFSTYADGSDRFGDHPDSSALPHLPHGEEDATKNLGQENGSSRKVNGRSISGSGLPTFGGNEEDAKSNLDDQENVPARKTRHSCILSGSGLSPLKILASQDNPNAEMRSPNRASLQGPRKWHPDRRFPVKVNSATSPEKPVVEEPETAPEDENVESNHLEQAIKIFEDDDTMMGNGEAEDIDTDMSLGREESQIEEAEQLGPDDTMVSTFSTFSAVPNMTMFARIGHTPTKYANVGATPTPHSYLDPSPQQTSRPAERRDSENTTNLLDFTEQIQNFSSRYSQQMTDLRGGSPGKYSTMAASVTPNKKRSTNLLDFDIPPLPTPRSIPTITPRELESLKSGFLSEISSLKASLSGKEAEVLSLKTAVADAEKRVGESLEELREIRAVKEGLIEQQEIWEKRGREVESVLRNVKEEIVRSQHERDQLEMKFEESEKRREAAEIMAQEAESKMAAMRAGKPRPDSPPNGSNKSPNKASSSREIELAVEKVSRELHALYKGKHESKITALKKSYENRWSKKVYELETKVEELIEENEKLRAGRDATMTKIDPNQSLLDDERKAQAVRDSTQIRELNAEIEKLEAVITSVKADNQELRLLLEKERVEKGELVQLAEEMMSMQSFSQTEAPPPPPPAVKPQPTMNDSFRSSIGRGTGIRPPGSIKKPSESRIGGLGNERKLGGLPRPGSGMGSRSGIMSSIEKMGNYRGRGD